MGIFNRSSTAVDRTDGVADNHPEIPIGVNVNAVFLSYRTTEVSVSIAGRRVT